MPEQIQAGARCPVCGRPESLERDPRGGVWFSRVNGRDVALVGVPSVACTMAGCLWAGPDVDPFRLALALALLPAETGVLAYHPAP